MTLSPALHSSARHDWRTPDYFLELVREAFGGIAYDPATNAENSTDAKRFSYRDPIHGPRTEYGKRWRGTRVEVPHYMGGGLSIAWPTDGLTYCNPEYGKHLDGPVDENAPIMRKGEVIGHGTGWARKMAQHEGEGLYLVPARVETDWFRRLHRWADWRLDWSSASLGARIRFDGGKDSAPFPSSVFYRGPRVSEFLRVFREHGTLVPGDRTLTLLLQTALRAV